MKLIGKTIVAVAKFYAACALINQIAYLDWKVRELETEVNKLKGEWKG